MVLRIVCEHQVHAAPPPPRAGFTKAPEDQVTWAFERVTTQNIKVVLVDPERNLIGVNGAVPGAKGSLVEIKETRKQ